MTGDTASGELFQPDEKPGTGEGPFSNANLAAILSDPHARLRDHNLVLRALNEGFAISDEVKALAMSASETLLRDNNARRKAKGVQFVMTAMKLNIDLIKMGHSDLAAVEKERRQQLQSGRYPSELPDAEPAVTKQPTMMSLENFVNSMAATTAPPLRIVDDGKRAAG